ncbi:MAG: patatin-like phospholipase family protein [candidate division WOR-3 bacterium]
MRAPVVPAPVRVGLALSGGAALGIAHIGVLKVLEREGIEVCAISGNSMGAMVGGLASAGYSAAQMESIAVAADYPLLFSTSVPFGARYLPERQQETRYLVQLRHRNLFPSLPSGLVPLQNVELLLAGLLADIEYNTQFDFDSLPLPYRAVAVDLVSGQREVLRRGRLTHAIRASIAIPGVFAPLQEGGRELVDGGVHQYLPVEPLLEFKPDFVIAVLTMKRNPETGVSLIDVVSRTTDIVGMADLKKQLAIADLVIEPNVDPFRHSDFVRARELIAAGESAAVKALPEIRRLLAGRVPIGGRKAVTYRPRPTVRSVRFEGLDITRPSLLVRELRTWSGATLDFAVLIDDMRRLFNTGLFEHVDYRLEFPAPGMVDVVLAVKERAYGFYSLGVRYDVRDGVLVGVELGQGNLVGSGAGARAAVTVGNPDELRLGVSGTRLFGLPFGYRLDAFSGLAEYDYYPGEAMPFVRYSLRYHGGLGEAGYVLGHDAFFTVGYQGFRAVYRGAAPLDTLRPEWVSGPRFRVEVNRLDDLYLPTRGRWLRFGGVVSRKSMGSGRNFIQATFAGGAVVPVGARLSLRPSMDAGLSLGVPAWAAYYRTGGESMTGFAPDEFTTPQRIVLRMGMDVLIVHLFGQRDYPLSIRLQSDVATFERPDNLFVAGDPRLFLHWGSGVGLVTNTPLGPLVCMLSYGDYLKPRPRHGGLNFTLTVGRDFRYER